MEFSTLTRRVADYSQIDPSDVEADAGNKSAASAPASGAGRRRRRRRRSLCRARTACQARDADKQEKAASLKGTPISLAAARAEAARKLPVDRNKYQTIRSLDQLKAWIARARETGHFAIDAKPTATIRCRPTSAASRWRWRRTTPAIFRSPTSNPAAAPDCSMLASRRTRSRPADALAALRPLLESAGILKIGFNIKFNAVMLAQHGITVRNHRRCAVDVVCARCRPQFARARCAGRALARPRRDQLWRAHRQRQEQAHLRSGRDRQGRRPIRPKMPT